MAHSYAQETDIQGEFKSLTFSTTSTPTLAQVGRWIDEEEAKAEASVGMKYAVPITGTKALLMMRTIVIGLVAGRVKNTIAVKSGADAANQGKVSDGDAMIKRSLDMLKSIRDGDIILADATIRSSADGVSSFNVDNEDANDDDADEVEDRVSGSTTTPLNIGNSVPSFQRGRRSW